MTTRNERNFDTVISPDEKERDREIHALSVVSATINAPGMYFILTGSYATEALTGKRLQHDDMDANIFTTDLTRDLPRAALLIEKLEVPGNSFDLYIKTADRLEYDLWLASEGVAPRRLEIQFVEITDVSGDQQLEFCLKSKKKGLVRVPTVLVPLKDSDANEFIFRVKSLPYTIATWAIRISGFAYSSKRPVRHSDLEQFKLLLTSGYNHNDVLSVIKHHPQMPKGIPESLIFEQALTVLSCRLPC